MQSLELANSSHFIKYLVHPSEPTRNSRIHIDSDIQEELRTNRYFLKKRVWRNAKKLRRHLT